MAVYTQISLFFISLFLSLPAFGQLKPVTVITSLVPPYTPYLGEYANDTGDKLSVTVVLNDSRVESHPVKLVMYLDLVGTGTVARTSPAAVTPIFYLGQGTLQLGGADLSAYFLPQNIDFSGELGQLFSTQGRIPDGLYRIGFHVVDAMRPDVVLSSSGYSPPSWFLLNPPPLPAMPADGEEVTLTSIQNVRFSWTPRHLGSGNAAFAAEYTFRLYRIAVAGVGKEQTVLSTFPVYTTTTNAASIFLGADDYQLEQGISYAWTVTAGTGEDGFTLFSNGGRSEARAFTYGCLCPVPYAPLPTSVRQSSATIGWEPDPLHMSFETGFRKAGDTEGTWHTVESYLGESSINNILEPLTSYEFRVRALCFNGEWSDYSPLSRFTTADMPKTDIDCGAVDEKVVVANTVPKPMLYAGEVLTYGQWKLVVTEASGANGIFSGRCDVAVPLFNNAKVRMVFNGITVNELNQVTAGIVRSESSDDSRLFVDDITDYLYEGDQTGNIIDNAAVAGIELGFSGSGGLTASVSGDSSSVTISSGSGSQTFSVDNLGDGTTVKDSHETRDSPFGNCLINDVSRRKT